MLLIWGQKWGRYRRYYYGLPLRRNLKPPLILAGVFKFIESWSNTNCLVLRRDLKAGALCEFCRQAKASMARRGRERRGSTRRLVAKSLPLHKIKQAPKRRLVIGKK